MGVAEWTDPHTIARAHAWLREAAERAGRHVTGPIEQPHVRPWSTVFRATTGRGPVYLKLCGPSQAHEPALTVLLAAAVPALVPQVLGVHPLEPWMLLADGGDKLRDVLTPSERLDVWAEVLPRYAALQRSLLGHEDAIRATGTPDHGLARLVADFRVVLDDERVLAPSASTLDDAARRRLLALLPTIEGEARELAASGIGATIQHDDLHDANVLMKGGRAVVAAAYRAGLDGHDASILRLRAAYLEPWTDLLPGRALDELADLGARLSTLTRALAWYRVVTLDEGALEGEPATMGEYLQNILGAFGPAGRTRWV